MQIYSWNRIYLLFFLEISGFCLEVRKQTILLRHTQASWTPKWRSVMLVVPRWCPSSHCLSWHHSNRMGSLFESPLLLLMVRLPIIILRRHLSTISKKCNYAADCNFNTRQLQRSVLDVDGRHASEKRLKNLLLSSNE